MSSQIILSTNAESRRDELLVAPGGSPGFMIDSDNFLLYTVTGFFKKHGNFVYMNIRQIVGDNIRFIRQKRNMSQEALAFDAMMSRTYIGEIERAKKNISVECLTRLARILEVEPGLLLTKEAYRNW